MVIRLVLFSSSLRFASLLYYRKERTKDFTSEFINFNIFAKHRTKIAFGERRKKEKKKFTLLLLSFMSTKMSKGFPSHRRKASNLSKKK